MAMAALQQRGGQRSVWREGGLSRGDTGSDR
jgi:hypothetical protein